MEQELRRLGIAFHKDNNVFLAVEDVAALQTAADRLSGAAAGPPLAESRCKPVRGEVVKRRNGLPERRDFSSAVCPKPAVLSYCPDWTSFNRLG